MAGRASAPCGQPGSQTIPASGRASDGSAPLTDGIRSSRRPERRGELAGRPSVSRGMGLPRRGARGRPPGADSDGPSPPPPKMRHSQQRRQAETARWPSGEATLPGCSSASADWPHGQGAHSLSGTPDWNWTLSRREPGTPAGARHARRVSGDGSGCLASGGRRCRSARPRPGSPLRPLCQPCLPRLPAYPLLSRLSECRARGSRWRPARLARWPVGRCPTSPRRRARAGGPRRARALAGFLSAPPDAQLGPPSPYRCLGEGRAGLRRGWCEAWPGSDAPKQASARPAEKQKGPPRPRRTDAWLARLRGRMSAVQRLARAPGMVIRAATRLVESGLLPVVRAAAQFPRDAAPAQRPERRAALSRPL
ncbi:UNVERIFIED_CONTAM: hypothetical protein K2H54_043688 [Gekko kuhli]